MFDGGAGTDTFGVVYGNLLKNALDQGPDGMQLVVDLTEGYAAERPASEDPNPGTAPVGATPPFGTDVPNVYKLVDIENAIGGPLNDWIRGTGGSVIEGGPGDDAITASGGSSVLQGGEGDDVLTATEAEFDILIGGPGADAFIGSGFSGTTRQWLEPRTTHRRARSHSNSLRLATIAFRLSTTPRAVMGSAILSTTLPPFRAESG